jgi:hypothetical protein
MTNNSVSGRVWCSIDQLWRVFPERLAWMAEPCRALALQLGFPIRNIYRAAMVGAHVGLSAIPEADEIHEEQLDAIHDAGILKAAQRGFPLSIDELLAIAKRARIAVERVLRVDPNPVRRAKLQATLDKMDALRADSARLAQQMLEQKQKVN